jgi:hypothetical protein
LPTTYATAPPSRRITNECTSMKPMRSTCSRPSALRTPNVSPRW